MWVRSTHPTIQHLTYATLANFTLTPIIPNYSQLFPIIPPIIPNGVWERENCPLQRLVILSDNRPERQR
jgi:hypothetical protein